MGKENGGLLILFWNAAMSTLRIANYVSQTRMSLYTALDFRDLNVVNVSLYERYFVETRCAFYAQSFLNEMCLLLSVSFVLLIALSYYSTSYNKREAH